MKKKEHNGEERSQEESPEQNSTHQTGKNKQSN
jgi:hypothetical protein